MLWNIVVEIVIYWLFWFEVNWLYKLNVNEIGFYLNVIGLLFFVWYNKISFCYLVDWVLVNICYYISIILVLVNIFEKKIKCRIILIYDFLVNFKVEY